MPGDYFYFGWKLVDESAYMPGQTFDVAAIFQVYKGKESVKKEIAEMDDSGVGKEHGEIPVGNLRDADFEELWFGPEMTHYRLLHIEGRFDAMPKCWSCGGINFYKIEPAEVRAYLEESDRLDLWAVYTTRMGLDVEGRPLAG